MRLLLPLEHGAWGVLLIPFLTTAAIARRADATVVLCLAAVFLLYLARHPLELLLAPEAQPFYRGEWRQAEASRAEAAVPARALLGWFALYATLAILAALPFLPAALRALGRVVWLGGRFEIKRLGWSEVAHSLLFAALLILTLGLRS